MTSSEMAVDTPKESTEEVVYNTYPDGTFLYNMSFVGIFGLWAISYFYA